MCSTTRSTGSRPCPRGDRTKRQGIHLGSIESRGSAIELIRLPTAAKPRVMDLLTRDMIISWLNPEPHAQAVYASCYRYAGDGRDVGRHHPRPWEWRAKSFAYVACRVGS